MSCHCQKDCHCQQNSSFTFGLIIGLVIAAVVAIVIYKNNREAVFIKLKKQLEKFFNSFKPKAEEIIESFPFTNSSNLSKKVNINNSAKISKKPDLKLHKIVKKKKTLSVVKKSPVLSKIDVVLPPKLIKKELEKKVLSPKSKPRVFKK